jgi:hypothetical protein
MLAGRHAILVGNAVRKTAFRRMRSRWGTNSMKQSPASKAATSQILKNLPTLSGTWNSISVFSKALHWPLSRVRWMHSIPLHPKSKSKSHYDRRSVSRYVLVSCPHLGLLTRVFFFQRYGLVSVGRLLWRSCFSKIIILKLILNNVVLRRGLNLAQDTVI